MKKYRKTSVLIIIFVTVLQLSGMSSVNTNDLGNSCTLTSKQKIKRSHIIGGGANFVRLGSGVALNIITSSLTKCDIYHTVYVYKNGILIHGKT